MVLASASQCDPPGSTAAGWARCRPWWPRPVRRLLRPSAPWTRWRSSRAPRAAASSRSCWWWSGPSAWSGPEENSEYRSDLHQLRGLTWWNDMLQTCGNPRMLCWDSAAQLGQDTDMYQYVEEYSVQSISMLLWDLVPVWPLTPPECLPWTRLLWTHLASLPFDLSGLGNRIPTFVDIKLFGEGFVLKVGILVKVLHEEKTHQRQSKGGKQEEISFL